MLLRAMLRHMRERFSRQRHTPATRLRCALRRYAMFRHLTLMIRPASIDAAAASFRVTFDIRHACFAAAPFDSQPRRHALLMPPRYVIRLI